MATKCDYCTKTKRAYLISDKGLMAIIYDKNMLRAVWDGPSGTYPNTQIAINYCPMCGRKLVEDEE